MFLSGIGNFLETTIISGPSRDSILSITISLTPISLSVLPCRLTDVRDAPPLFRLGLTTFRHFS